MFDDGSLLSSIIPYDLLLLVSFMIELLTTVAGVAASATIERISIAPEYFLVFKYILFCSILTCPLEVISIALNSALSLSVLIIVLPIISALSSLLT